MQLPKSLQVALFFLISTACSEISKRDDNSQLKEHEQNSKKLLTNLNNEQKVKVSLPDSSIISRLPPDGGKKFNRLIFESSPYLLQHAGNPIDWYPWGEKAFSKAIEEDKPIFLSIGYTTCHWCHVMEHESFEDEEVANVLNKDYVCIKVDREERPDLDHLYMSVTQMMTGRGGWPMTVIMSPNKVPFFAGTYFPKSSMLQLVPHFAHIWKKERQKVTEIGEAIIKSLHELEENRAGGDLNASHLDACFFALKENYDYKFGGFGESPKFPTAHNLSFLLRYYNRTGKLEALEMVEHTLQKIHQGGVYDQVGYGIHRYSVDNKWLVPHFEKMLYDQALFCLANLECFQVTRNSYYANTANEILTYVTRDLTSPEGGFYSAEDADSDGEEGKFYIWKIEQIKKILGQKDGTVFSEIYQLSEKGNYLDEVTHKKTGSNIPHLNQSIEEHATIQKIQPEKLRERILSWKNKLFIERKKRIRPQKDDKVLTDWNGLMISAFSKASMVLERKEYLDTAKRAADFCLSSLRRNDGRLLKRWCKGKAGLPAHLEDYAFLGQGLLDLYEASFDEKYLRAGIQITDLALKHFEDKNNGGFFMTADDGEKLLIRAKEIYDGAIPSGNSVMALNLLRINKITGMKKYLESADKLFSAFSGFLEKNPQGTEVLLQALDFALASAKEIIIAENPEKIKNSPLLKEIKKQFLPSKVLLFRPTGLKKEGGILKIAPYLKKYGLIDNRGAVYICENYSCKKPVTNLFDLRMALRKD